MNNRSDLTVPAWLLHRLAPKHDREAILGDLAEEQALRSESDSAETVSRWLTLQQLASLPPLAWTSLSRSAWARTLAVGFGAYIIGAALCLTIDQAFLFLLGPGPRWLPGAGIVLANVALVAYVAARIRPAASVLLACVIFADYCTQLLGEPMAPTWYIVTILVFGPLVAIISGRVAARALA